MGFLICGACARHVKDAERACPFCGAATRNANRAGNPGQSRARSRLAILFGVSTAFAASASLSSCSDSSTTSEFMGDADRDVALTSVDGYGAVIVDGDFYRPDALEASATDTGHDAESSDTSDASSD